MPEHTISSVSDPSEPPSGKRKPRRIQPVRLLRKLGPGIIAGASDDDPSAVGTYVVAGASYGYATLWTALITLPMMIVVQYMCAKIGMVTRRGLGSVLHERYPKWLVYGVVILLLITNTLTAGADVGAMAAALNLVIPVAPTVLTLIIVAIMLAFQILGSYKQISNVFKWTALLLLAYVISAFFAHADWGDVLRHTVIPTIQLNTDFLLLLVAIFGQALTPYMLFWQADEEAEEKKAQTPRRFSRSPWQKRNTSDSELRFAFWDVTLGMVLSNIVMYFIIVTTGATLHQSGQTNVQSAAQAAQALQPLAGDAAKWLFAIGMVSAGFLSVPILTTSASYVVAQVMGWRFGLDQKLHQARNFYAVLILVMVIGTLMNFLGINPIDALFWVSVLSGVLVAPLLALVLHIANDRKLMQTRVNTRLINVFGGLTLLIAIAAAVGAIWSILTPHHS